MREQAKNLREMLAFGLVSSKLCITYYFLEKLKQFSGRRLKMDCLQKKEGVVSLDRWLGNEIAFLIFKKEINFSSSTNKFIITKHEANIDII